MECVINGCVGQQKSRGMCGTHYHAWWVANRSKAPDKRTNQKIPIGSRCQVDDCDKLAGRRQLCNAHYIRLNRHGDVNVVKTRPRRKCTLCDSPAVGRGLCKSHYGAIVYTPARLERWQAMRREYLDHRGDTCDMCGAPEPRNLDHDHAHCRSGCSKCYRGMLCASCNFFEGLLAAAIARGSITIGGPVAEYLADPPFQRWLRERGAADDAPLAA